MDHISVNNRSAKYAMLLVNGIPFDEALFRATGRSVIRGLYPVWGGALVNRQEQSLIWELLDGRVSGTLPVLLCPEDLDFSCIIVAAELSWNTDTVSFSRIGIVSRENYSLQKELESGILRTDCWSEEEWELYAGTLAWCNTESLEWQEWVCDNWEEEQKRRLHNYFLPFLQDSANIEWLEAQRPAFTFSRNEFVGCLDLLRKGSGYEDIC